MNVGPRRVIAAAALVVAVLFMGWSCSSAETGEPSGRAGTSNIPPAPAQSNIDQLIPEPAVAPAPGATAAAAETAIRQALTTSFTWYPSTDTSTTDAFLRARQWFTEDLAAQLSTSVSTERGPGSEWEQWKEERAEITATVSIGCSGCPADTAERIHRVVEISQSVVTSDAVTRIGSTTIVWVSAVQTATGWSVDTLHF
ncbi:hypothetical protein [Rhodococcoides fascians]|uniref:hypothetical protein n=1 Tax=Rhodococcoides fascians TaxID=1828 RepID=UPI00366DCB59